MQPFEPQSVQRQIEEWAGQELYLHLEMTSGAYASHNDSSKITAGTYIRNGRIRYLHGSVAGSGPYRVGLKMADGWVYSEGLTHWELDGQGRLLMSGHDDEGRLVVAMELSQEPF